MRTLKISVLLCGLIVAACATIQPGVWPPQNVPVAPAPPAARADAPVDIVIQGAVDSELQPLLAALEDKELVQIAAWTFWRGRLGGLRAVISRTEVGPVNAAAATTLAIVNFRPRLIINQGTAGADDPDLKVFDIVVGEATVDYGAFRSARAEAGAGVDMARWTPSVSGPSRARGIRLCLGRPVLGASGHGASDNVTSTRPGGPRCVPGMLISLEVQVLCPT
jgi:hypothetical protein